MPAVSGRKLGVEICIISSVITVYQVEHGRTCRQSTIHTGNSWLSSLRRPERSCIHSIMKVERKRVSCRHLSLWSIPVNCLGVVFLWMWFFCRNNEKWSILNFYELNNQSPLGGSWIIYEMSNIPTCNSYAFFFSADCSTLLMHVYCPHQFCKESTHLTDGKVAFVSEVIRKKVLIFWNIF